MLLKYKGVKSTKRANLSHNFAKKRSNEGKKFLSETF